MDYWIVIDSRHFRRKELISATTPFEARAILKARYSGCAITIVTVNEVRKKQKRAEGERICRFILKS